MATTQNEIFATYKAAADYSAVANKYKLVRFDTAAAEQVILCSVLGQRVDAVLGNNPGLGQPAECIMDDQTKCLAGAAIATAGLELTTDATGRAIVAVSTNFVFGISTGPAAAAGEFVPFNRCVYVKP